MGLGFVSEICCFAAESLELRQAGFKFRDAIVPLTAPLA